MSINILTIIEDLNEFQDLNDLTPRTESHYSARKNSDIRSRLASDLESVIWMTDGGSWSHKAPLTTNDKIPNDRKTVSLNQAAINYFSQNEVKRDDLDWFYIDLLLYYSNKRMINTSEALVGDQFSGAFTHGFRMTLEGRAWMGIALVLGKFIKWLVLLFLIFLPFSNRDEIGALVISAGAILYAISDRIIRGNEYSKMRSKIFDRIWAANQVYSLRKVCKTPRHPHW